MAYAALPIEQVLPEILAALHERPNLVLQAEPGAGKTTRVPLALRSASWCTNKIIMLEPRRLAAQLAARFMAHSLGEPVGESIGYRIRGESRVSSRTKIEVITEGILTRMLQSDPELPGVSAVIFDEFHERRLQADLGLALCLESQATLRPELRLVVMSATLDGEQVAALMGNSQVVTCPGRAYPVTTVYREGGQNDRLERRVTEAVEHALRSHEGDILAFLPGRAEIARTESTLLERLRDPAIEIFPLASELGPDAQQRALAPSASGARKVILATSIAETSVTINGVRIVIDCGLTRTQRFDPGRAISALETVSVSQASADQRRGRAGRESAGFCYRLWSEHEHKNLPRFTAAEIAHADLMPFVLELAAWGVSEAHTLRFLTAPPQGTFTQAQQRLKDLGAIDLEHRITERGRQISALSVHPRLAAMLLRGREIGLGGLACDLCAILEERDFLRGREHEVDLYSRWQVLSDFRHGRGARSGTQQVVVRVSQQANRLMADLAITEVAESSVGLGLLVAFAYPERIAQRRGDESRRYLLNGGVGATLPERSLLDRHEYLAIAELDGSAAHARIFLCEPLTLDEIEKYFSYKIAAHERIEWDPVRNSVAAFSEERLGALVLRTRTVKPSAEVLGRLWASRVREEGLSILQWSEEAQSLRVRSEWLRQFGGADSHWPDLSEEWLRQNVERWLIPRIGMLMNLRQLESSVLTEALRALFSWQDLQTLEALAPAYLELPTGTRACLDYSQGEFPVLSVMLQEMFGAAETPRVANGKIPVVVHLLSPARRPLQVTKDLASFWRNAYIEVRKEMLGRYPKHVWPEDPLHAAPTRKAKPRARK